MTERISRLDPISITREWIEHVIIADRHCPPLRAEAAKCMNEQGGVDWNKLSSKVMITNLHGKPKEFAKTQAAHQFWGYIKQISTPDEVPPMTRVWILPDTASNADFDGYMSEIKQGVQSLFLKEKSLITLKRVARQMISRIPSISLTEDQIQVRFKDPYWAAMQSAVIVDETMGPAYFYGKPLSDSDVSDFTTERGDVNRYKILSRAPFNMMQVVNPFYMTRFQITSGKRGIERILSTPQHRTSEIMI